MVDEQNVNSCLNKDLAIQVSNLSYRYPDGSPALHQIDFSVTPHERIALIGPNGAGKSTLLAHLNGIIHTSPHINIFGIPVIKKNLPQIRQQVGLVFQDPDDQLFCSTIFEDVAFGPLNMGLSREEVNQRVQKALHWVQLDGYEERSAFHLSGGEKKRASLATVLAMDVNILALDEPSSNLDPKSRRGLIHWLQDCDKTLLIATHDLDMAYETTDRVLLLENGRLLADGPCKQILRDKELLEGAGLELPLRFQHCE